MYREPAEKKHMQMRVMVTCSEVASIIREYLVRTGRMPDERANGRSYVGRLQDDEMFGRLLVPKNNGDAAAVIFIWDDQLDAAPAPRPPLLLPPQKT